MKMIQKIKLLCRNIQYFGMFIPVVNILILYGYKFLPKFILKKLAKQKHCKVEKYIWKRLGNVVTSYKGEHYSISYSKKAPIWYCWLQGENNMPEIPTLCLESIKKHSNEHPIYIITFDNHKRYVELPAFIITLYETKKIKAAHFSDILRMALLYKYGGAWIDATIFLSKDISEEIFTYPFYSIKTEEEGYYISRCRWSGFFLAGMKRNPIFGALLELYYAYLKENELFVDYLMMDYFIDILYQSKVEIKEMIDQIPPNNPNIYFLKNVLCKEFDQVVWEGVTRNTNIFKLDWRMYSHNELIQNKSNYYNYLKSL